MRSVISCARRAALAGALVCFPSFAADAPRAFARVEAIQPPVWVERAGVRTVAKPGWALYSGDRLITDANGRLQLSLAGDAQLRLGSSADVNLGAPQGGSSAVITVTSGAIRYTAPAVASAQPMLRLGDVVEVTVGSGEIWASADADRFQLGLVRGLASVRVAGGAPSQLDEPESMLSIARGASSRPAAPVDKDKLSWWLSQTDLARPTLTADGTWAVALMASVDAEAARALACRVHDRGYPAEIFLRPSPEGTWHRLTVRRLGSEADAKAFVKTAGDMKFKGPMVLAPAQAAALGEPVTACAKSQVAGEAWIAKLPAAAVSGEPARAAAPEQGVKVRGFLVEGVKPHAEQGIEPAQVQAVANQAFAKLAAAQPEASLTPTQMQQVADEVKDHYRARGFVIAFAYVPAQTVGADGIVKIQVLEGRLESVVVDGEHAYSEKTLKRPANSLVGTSPTQDAVEAAVLYAQDYPGVRLSGVLRPGGQAGDAQLLLRVSGEDRFDFTVGGDNYGSENSGEFRLRAGASWNSPTGNGDRLDLSLLQSFSPTDTTSGSVGYQMPLGHPEWTLSAGYGRNEFQVSEGPFKSLQLEGTIDSQHAGLGWRFKRSRALNVGTSLTYTRKDSELVALDTLDITDDQLGLVSLSLSADRLDTALRGADEGGIGVRQAIGGHYQPGGGAKQKPDFTIFDLRYARLQPLAATQSLLLTVRAQHTGDPLSVLEQFPMSGPSGVRAYPVGDFLRDQGQFASLEYRVNAPGFASRPGPFGRAWGELLQFRVFFDYANGEQAKAPTGSSDTSKVDLSGAGVGVQFGAPRTFRWLLQGASRVSGPTPSDGDDFRLYTEFSVPF